MGWDHCTIIKKYVNMEPLNNDENWRYWPIPLSRVCHTLARTHPDQISHSVAASTSQVRHPYLSAKSCLHLNRQNSNRRDGVDVGRQLKRSVHARSCQTNGGFTLLSLAHHANPHLLPHPSLPIASLFMQTTPPPSLSPSFSSSLHCSSCPSRSSVRPLWRNTKQ